MYRSAEEAARARAEAEASAYADPRRARAELAYAELRAAVQQRDLSRGRERLANRVDVNLVRLRWIERARHNCRTEAGAPRPQPSRTGTTAARTGWHDRCDSAPRIAAASSRAAPLLMTSRAASTQVTPLPDKDVRGARLDELCEFPPEDDAQEARVLWFVELARWMRPARRQRRTAKLRFFLLQLDKHPEWRERVAKTFGALVRSCELERLFAYGGIPREFHFGGAVREWFVEKVLPAACKTDDAAQILGLAFSDADLAWLGTRELAAVLRAIAEPGLAEIVEAAAREALVDLAHQVVAQAHAPAIRALAHSERSPFRGLYEAVVAFNADPRAPRADETIRGRVRQCLLLLDDHRAELLERGADLNTTFQLARVRQQLERMTLLASLLHAPTDDALARAAARIVGSVTRNRKGQHLFARSSELVVRNLVESAASVGRSYLEEEQSSFRAAFLAGAGGGALMAIATGVKFFLSERHLPHLYEGVVFSLNYAAIFCAAYLLHFTIATKLPAHTATALAQSVQSTGSHRARIAAFIRVWRALLRLQIAGLLGNIAVAGPLAFAFDVIAVALTGHHLIDRTHAAQVLSSNSILGPSVIYAALTGLFLWISSLIGAAGDNWTRVNHLCDRLATNVLVMKRFRPERARERARAITSRIGGLLGNASLGVLLGGVPAAFAIASLPVEIRHVTVSTSSVAIAFATGEGRGMPWVLAILGVVVIALVNVTVSFLLALWLALRAARDPRAYRSSRAVVRVGIRRWLRGAHVVDPNASATVAELVTPERPVSSVRKRADDERSGLRTRASH